MGLKCLYQIALENTTGSSDKLYIIQVQEEERPPVIGSLPEFKIMCYYGRRGQMLKEVCKADKVTSIAAHVNAGKLALEKQRKGYTHMSLKEGEPVPGMPSHAPGYAGENVKGSAVHVYEVEGPLPMLATPLKDAHISTRVTNEETCLNILMESDKWVMQRKFDGERILIKLDRSIDSGILATNRTGYRRALPSSIREQLESVLAQPWFGNNRSVVLDGEIMGEEIVFFDLAKVSSSGVALNFEERYDLLHTLLYPFEQSIADVAWNTSEKTQMYAMAQKHGWEGVILRSISNKYLEGTRVNTVIKHKFWNSCTCRVLEINTKNSIKVALRDADGVEAFAGNVTVPESTSPYPQVGDLVEIKYLYALDGGSLYQPSFLGVRTDLDQADLRSSIQGPPPEKR